MSNIHELYKNVYTQKGNVALLALKIEGELEFTIIPNIESIEESPEYDSEAVGALATEVAPDDKTYKGSTITANIYYTSDYPSLKKLRNIQEPLSGEILLSETNNWDKTPPRKGQATITCTNKNINSGENQKITVEISVGALTEVPTLEISALFLETSKDTRTI